MDGDGAELYSGEVWQATVACSGHFGGGSQVEADPSDGLLERSRSRPAPGWRWRSAPAECGRGTLEEQNGVHKRRAEVFTLEVEHETSLNVDGELCVRSGEVRFTVDPSGSSSRSVEREQLLDV